MQWLNWVTVFGLVAVVVGLVGAIVIAIGGKK